jgi:hypothetical protein
MKTLVFLFLIIITASCYTQRTATMYTQKHNKSQSTVFELVVKKLKRKPMSQRKKYRRPMRKTCAVYVTNQPKQYNYSPINGSFKNSGCGRFTYGVK